MELRGVHFVLQKMEDLVCCLGILQLYELAPWRGSALLEKDSSRNVKDESDSFGRQPTSSRKGEENACALKRICVALWIFPRMPGEVSERWVKLLKWE